MSKNYWFGPGPGKRRPSQQPRERVDLRKIIDETDQGRMVRWLSGVGELDTNDPCDEWPIP